MKRLVKPLQAVRRNFLVIEPRRVRSPLEYSAGTSPVKPMNARAEPSRRQSTTLADRPAG
jgi:hypothetical protein